MLPALPLAILEAAMALAPAASPAIRPTPAELDLSHRWAQAKFAGITTPEPTRAGIVVHANNDPVQKNSRNGHPMNITGKVFTRGLYCHAVSRLQVRLPGPATSFQATIGVDSNSDTSGGRGSVTFHVRAGDQELFKTGVVHEGAAPQPVKVDLKGASEVWLLVGDGGDGIPCDQADWADARVTLADGSTLWLADLPIIDSAAKPPSTDLPFSFTYGGKPSAGLLAAWGVVRERRNLDANRIEHILTWKDPETGLVVRQAGIEYRDYATVEWTLTFRNTGNADTPILQGIRSLDTSLDRGSAGEYTLHHQRGTLVAANDFEPLQTALKPGKTPHFASRGGRPCGTEFPYFNVEWPGQGVIAVVGWPGQWSADFIRDGDTGLRVVAGQETTHFTLHPGEEVRTPLMVLQFWEGDFQRSQNLWRRWMVDHSMPRPGGKLPGPLMTPCSSHWFAEMINANEENQKYFVDRYVAERIKIDYWWMDAGWYVNETGWPNTGTWEVDLKRFPHGLRAISDHARTKGIQTLVWFEPERVTPGTWLYTQHPEWLIGPDGQQKLLDLGNPVAREWLTNHIDNLLKEQGIDFYRQDYNVDPLGYWQGADAPDRQGITENHYVTGYLAYWDELRRRHPNMLIDSCASGGHRNDLETLRRAVPMLRSDWIQDPVGNQGHTYGLSYWFPYYGTGTHQVDPYELRSAMSGPGFIACWDMRDKSLDYNLLRKLSAQWRDYSPLYLADYYPLTSYSLEATDWIGWQFNKPETGQGLVQVFRRASSPYEAARFKLHGLEAAATYLVTDPDSGKSAESRGSDLMEKGLAVTVALQPGAIVRTYRKK